MASKENEEREHPEDKKTGVKLIYQGQEKKVIIVSTIRSSLEYVSMGSQNRLGFLFNSKRFNLGIKKQRTYDLCERENRSKVERENSSIMWTNQIQSWEIKESLLRMKEKVEM